MCCGCADVVVVRSAVAADVPLGCPVWRKVVGTMLTCVRVHVGTYYMCLLTWHTACVC